MFRLFILLTTILVSALRAVLRSRSDLVLENIALRQQVEALKRRRRRPQLDDADRAFWLAMRSAWGGWAARLILVQPDTVVRWHRDRFQRYWSKLSRQNPRPGRQRGRVSRKFYEDDADGDGVVSRTEFSGPADHFDRLDRNSDGAIQQSEARQGPPDMERQNRGDRWK